VFGGDLRHLRRQQPTVLCRLVVRHQLLVLRQQVHPLWRQW
jgi:alpha-ketoglutarate-dependent taurine dioxygenase